jgi:hypothetical protein
VAGAAVGQWQPAVALPFALGETAAPCRRRAPDRRPRSGRRGCTQPPMVRPAHSSPTVPCVGGARGALGGAGRARGDELFTQLCSVLLTQRLNSCLRVLLTRLNTWLTALLTQLFEQCLNVNPHPRQAPWGGWTRRARGDRSCRAFEQLPEGAVNTAFEQLSESAVNTFEHLAKRTVNTAV